MEKNSWDTGWYIVHQKQQFTASDGDSSLIKQIHTGSHGFKTVEIKSKGIRNTKLLLYTRTTTLWKELKIKLACEKAID